METTGVTQRGYSCPFVLLGNLFNQADYSDIELIVDLEHFYAHRIILAARSEYFRALLYGGLRESQHDNHTIEIKECKSAAFKIDRKSVV